MKEDTQEKALIQVNEKSIFYRIKSFFRNLFYKNQVANEVNVIKNNIENITKKENVKYSFIETIRNIEDEETKLLKLQRQYRSGEIKEEELTEEQVNSLCSLYDKQIANLRKSNEMRRQKLLEYRMKLQTEN